MQNVEGSVIFVSSVYNIIVNDFFKTSNSLEGAYNLMKVSVEKTSFVKSF
jgi:hypothetical protein